MTWRWNELAPEAAATIRTWSPIALVSSPRLARVLGLSPQALKNWRLRGQGPSPEPAALYGAPPVPVFYRVSTVLAWLDGKLAPDAWQYERAWLVGRFRDWRFVLPSGRIDIGDELNEAETDAIARHIRAKKKDDFALRGVVWPGEQPRARPPSLIRASVARDGLEDRNF